MKYQTTQKAVKAGYSDIITIPYCDLQYLLHYENAVAYTAGVYGWNANIYEIAPGVAICTGYRPFGNIKPGYECIQKYEKAARKIVYDSTVNYERKPAKLKKLLEKFMKEVVNND